MTRRAAKTKTGTVRYDAVGAVTAVVGSLHWSAIHQSLDSDGIASIGRLLDPSQCRELIALYDRDASFRSRVVMARHGFGSGEYKYLDHPLPGIVTALREALYPHLAAVANQWRRRLGEKPDFPAEHQTFLTQCHQAGQTRPTPLLLKYETGDYNCLHQDLYGAVMFPLQVVILLSAPATDFSGGEFVVVEQRPRRQSRAEVLAPAQGEAIVFAVNERPHAGARGDYRVKMRHGVSRIRAGRRFTLGIIFHDAA